MRIAIITYEYPPDTGKAGIATYSRQIAEVLAIAGCDVHVFAGSHTRQEDSIESTINVHRVKCSSPQNFNTNVVEVFKNEQMCMAFDIMECPEIHGNAREIKKMYPQIPLVVRLHAPNWLVENLKKKYIPFFAKLRFVIGAIKRGKLDAGYWRTYDILNDTDRQFTLLADAVSAPSQTMKNWAVATWNLPDSGVKVIPNPFVPTLGFLQIPIYTEAINKEILFFGRLNVLKGMVNATIAMKTILKIYPEYSFKVIGDDGPGPKHGQNMKQWMTEQLKDVVERVHFLDGLAYDALPAAIADSEIILLPSLFESFSYTCAEAMAAGKAVVGCQATGMAEMIEHNYSGILVDAAKPTEICKALKRLIEDNDLRYKIAVNARESITTKYSGEKIAALYLSYFKMLSGLHE